MEHKRQASDGTWLKLVPVKPPAPFKVRVQLLHDIDIEQDAEDQMSAFALALKLAKKYTWSYITIERNDLS